MTGHVAVAGTDLKRWRAHQHCPAIWGGGFWYLRRKSDGAIWTGKTFDTAAEALAYARKNFPDVEINLKRVSHR